MVRQQIKHTNDGVGDMQMPHLTALPRPAMLPALPDVRLIRLGPIAGTADGARLNAITGVVRMKPPVIPGDGISDIKRISISDIEEEADRQRQLRRTERPNTPPRWHEHLRPASAKADCAGLGVAPSDIDTSELAWRHACARP
ncbi:MAG: hypothetical protein ACU0DH_05965 [Paracoccus sp. (in: a-proteobacteria)]|uniref:hypothetical protein n=1 Tax=Paracoccus sp. TaxID=267 RepID=UPI004058351A